MKEEAASSDHKKNSMVKGEEEKKADQQVGSSGSSPMLSCPSAATEDGDGEDHGPLEIQQGRVEVKVVEDHSNLPPRKEEDNRVTDISEDDDSSTEFLLQAISTLTSLASLDSSDYQQRLTNNSLPTISVSTTPTVSNQTQQSKDFVLKLEHVICRLQGLVSNLNVENEQQTLELLDLQQQLSESRDREAKLGKAVEKLLARNTKLKEKRASQKIMKHRIMDQVTQKLSAKNQQEEAEFYKLAERVQQHEQTIRIQQIQQSRERTHSDFSLDREGLQDFGGSSCGDSMSACSYVTDNSEPTLRLEAPSHSFEEGIVTGPARSRASTKSGGSISSLDDEFILTLGATTGDKLSKVTPKKSNSSNPKSTKTPLAPPPTTKRVSSSATTTTPSTSSNPFAAFLTPKTSSAPFTLSFYAPFYMQIVQIPVEGDGDDAMCVCGFHGFDSNANVLPTVGVRILELDSKPIDPDWNADALEEAIRNLNLRKRASITFRNDVFSKSQKKVLQTAIEAHQAKYPDEISTSSLLAKDPMSLFRHKRTSATASTAAGGESSSSAMKSNFMGMFSFKDSSTPTPTTTSTPDRKGVTTGSLTKKSPFRSSKAKPPPPVISNSDEGSEVKAKPQRGGSPLKGMMASIKTSTTRRRTKSEEEVVDFSSVFEDKKGKGVAIDTCGDEDKAERNEESPTDSSPLLLNASSTTAASTNPTPNPRNATEDFRDPEEHPDIADEKKEENADPATKTPAAEVVVPEKPPTEKTSTRSSMMKSMDKYFTYR